MKRPNLDGPVLQGARDNTAVWTVLVPPGWEAETLGGKNGLRSGLAQAASLSWQRAAAQFSISAALAQRSADGAGAAALAEAQRRFYIECRRARLRLEAVPVDTSGAWPVGRAPLEALSDLLQKNKDLADKRRFEPIRAKAEQQAEAKGSLPSEGSLDEGMGRLLYAVRDAGEPAPELALRPSQFDRLLNAWRLSWMWTGLLLLAALLSLFRPAWVWLRFFWPEQIGLVGLAGWWAAGATWVVLALLALALSARLWIILLAAGRVFRRPPPDKPKTTTNLPAIS